MPAKPTVYLIDRPGSEQSLIIAGHVAPPKNNPDEVGIETMLNILGNDFTSRVNMNLREDKHWSYGAFVFIRDARGQRPFIGYAPVQTDKTKESMIELARELRDIVGNRPITNDEFAKAQTNAALQLPGSWETMAAVGGSLGQIVQFGFPDSYFQTYAQRIRALKLDDVQTAANKVVHQDNLVWVVIGDRAKIEAGVRELNFGELRYIDADGNPVK